MVFSSDNQSEERKALLKQQHGVVVAPEVAELSTLLNAFACQECLPDKDYIVLTGPKYSGKSLAVVLLEYALPATTTRPVIYVQSEVANEYELLVRLQEQLTSSFVGVFDENDFKSVKYLAFVIRQKAQNGQLKPYALVLDRAEVLKPQNMYPVERQLIGTLNEHAHVKIHVASPQAMLGKSHYDGLNVDYKTLSLPHTEEEKDQLWAALGIDSPFDTPWLEKLAGEVSFLPGLLAKLAKVAREGGTEEQARKVIEFQNLWSNELKAFKEKAPQGWDWRWHIEQLGRVGRPLGKDFLVAEESTLDDVNTLSEAQSRVLGFEDQETLVKSGLTIERCGRLHLIAPDRLLEMAGCGLESNLEARYYSESKRYGRGLAYELYCLDYIRANNVELQIPGSHSNTVVELPLAQRGVYEHAMTKDMLRRERIVVKLEPNKPVVDLLLSTGDGKTLYAIQCSLSSYNSHSTKKDEFENRPFAAYEQR